MVRVARFSFDDGMNIRYPIPRESFDDDDLDDFVPEEELREPPPGRAAPPARSRGGKSNPADRRGDRRHLAGGDWMGQSPDERFASPQNPLDSSPGEA